MNNTANIKQLELIRFVNENSEDEHIMSKISIVLRRDKIEAPYYMITSVKISTCLDNPDKGLIHAMDMLNYNRKHNLTEKAYNEIKSLILDNYQKSDQVTLTENDNQINMVLMTLNEEENRMLFENYGELFEKIDNLIN